MDAVPPVFGIRSHVNLMRAKQDRTCNRVQAPDVLVAPDHEAEALTKTFFGQQGRHIRMRTTQRLAKRDQIAYP